MKSYVSRVLGDSLRYSSQSPIGSNRETTSRTKLRPRSVPRSALRSIIRPSRRPTLLAHVRVHRFAVRLPPSSDRFAPRRLNRLSTLGPNSLSVLKVSSNCHLTLPPRPSRRGWLGTLRRERLWKPFGQSCPAQCGAVQC